jgi:hypothetical protein
MMPETPSIKPDSPNELEAYPTITIVDLQNAIRIIDAAAERGAFRGSELSMVGMVRDRYARFLDAVGVKVEASPVGCDPQ